MLIVRTILQRFKQHWDVQIPANTVGQACQEIGYTFRKRVLDPLTTIQLLFLQVLHGNTACEDLPHLSGIDFSASAYCQARMRLPLEVLCQVVRGIIAKLVSATAEVSRWHGHRIWLVDGSGFSMPDAPQLQKHFPQPGGQKPGCGFPAASISALSDAATGLLVDVLVRPLRTHDLTGVVSLHPQLRKGDVLAGDRAFGSFAHLALLLAAGLHGVFRVHQKRKVSFRKRKDRRIHGKLKGKPTTRLVKKLARFDQIVEYLKPKQCPKWMSREQYALLPQVICVRELRYWTKRRGYRTRQVTLVTTLLDPVAYPADELREVYGGRWAVETNFSHLKTTMHMDVLHSKTVDGVKKELWMFVLVYNLVRMVMLEAADRQKVPVERISFIDALRWLAHAKPGSDLPALHVNPDRPGRYEPRVIKRRAKPYDLMNRTRKELRKALTAKRVAA